MCILAPRRSQKISEEKILMSKAKTGVFVWLFVPAVVLSQQSVDLLPGEIVELDAHGD